MSRGIKKIKKVFNLEKKLFVNIINHYVYRNG